MTDRLVWIDCEMTGLDLDKDALIEVAVLVTDAELNVLGDGIDVVVAPPADALPGLLAGMVQVVREMHTASGLLAELAGGIPMAEAQERVLAYVREHVPEAGTAQLAGNSVGFDRRFLARDMPELEQYLHYRVVDVTSVGELARRWYPKVRSNSPKRTGNHRALGDIRDSIAELRYYRDAIFVAPAEASTSGSASAV
ncbi:oligoribonuclease [Catenulispora sp. EB89]|uniref:oligoribonuclease n=1 Tax=Catenulispora sp. EB89 TaxID=3156257 RepID=UPI003514C635